MQAARREGPVGGGMDGYSLLEILIVLAVMGLMLGLATPNFVRMLEQQRRHAALATVEAYLAGLPGEARRASRDSVLLATPSQDLAADAQESLRAIAPPRDLPVGWRIVPQTDIRVRFDGVCAGGVVDIFEGERAIARYRLDPPTCTPKKATRVAAP